MGHALEKYAVAHGGGELVDDVCLPRAALAEFFTRMRSIADEHDVLIAVAGHAGDGNMHPNVLFDAQDPSFVARAYAAFDVIMAMGLALGGTITGEHGVGVLKNRVARTRSWTWSRSVSTPRSRGNSIRGASSAPARCWESWRDD